MVGSLDRGPAGKSATAINQTSNKSFGDWQEFFGDPVIATAILDRLHCRVVNITGATYRLQGHLITKQIIKEQKDKISNS